MQQKEPQSPYQQQEWEQPYPSSPYAHQQASSYFHSQQPLPANGPRQVAARGLAQAFGLHPAMAVLIVAADLMLHAADVVTAGLLIPLSAAAGVVIGIITFLAQRKWFSDGNDSALIKALIVALLTAIPSPLPYVLFVPAGFVGFFRRK